MWAEYAVPVQDVGKSIFLSETFSAVVQCFQCFHKLFPIKMDFWLPLKSEISDNNGQAMRRYIPGTCLLVADRPQPPVRTGATALVLLSRLRRLMLPTVGEKSSSRPLLAVAIFLFFGHAQNPLHVVFGSEQFYHFCLGLLVFWIPLSVLSLQHGVLLFQRLHER